MTRSYRSELIKVSRLIVRDEIPSLSLRMRLATAVQAVRTEGHPDLVDLLGAAGAILQTQIPSKDLVNQLAKGS